MANYKKFGRQSISIAGVSMKIPEYADAVTLYKQHNLGGAPQNMIVAASAVTAYQVPIGKVFHMLGFGVNHTATSALVKVYEGETSAAIDNLRLTLTTPTYAGNSEIQIATPDTYGAGYYVVVDPASTNINYTYAIGWQDDE